MVLPRLLHPVPTEIERIDRDSVIVDEDYGEPFETVARHSTVTIDGQWKWEQDNSLRATDAGAEEGADGYVLFRLTDIRDAGFTSIRRGDKIIAYGSGANRVETNVFVIKIKYSGHYPDQSGPSLLKAFFADRNPTEAPGAGVV